MPDQAVLSFVKFLSDSFLGGSFQFCVHMCILGCEQLGSKPSCWRETPMYILTCGLPSCPAIEGRRMRLSVLPMFMCVLQVSAWELCGQPCVVTYVYSVCMCFVCECLVNTSSASLLPGHRAAAVSPLLGCWIWYDKLSSSNDYSPIKK